MQDRYIIYNTITLSAKPVALEIASGHSRIAGLKRAAAGLKKKEKAYFVLELWIKVVYIFQNF
jgi:hypothetical protein